MLCWASGSNNLTLQRSEGWLLVVRQWWFADSVIVVVIIIIESCSMSTPDCTNPVESPQRVPWSSCLETSHHGTEEGTSQNLHFGYLCGCWPQRSGTCFEFSVSGHYQFKKQLACGVFQDCHVVASSITIMSCIAHVLPVVNKVKRVCLPFPPFSLSTT